MSDIANRIASLSPEKRAVLLHRLETVRTEQNTSTEQSIIFGPMPLLPTQKQLLVMLTRYHLNIHHFNTTTLLVIDFPLVRTFAEQATRHLLKHHDALRIRLKRENDDWQQFITPPDESTPFSTIDLSTLPANIQAQAITEHAAQLQSSLNLFEGPIMRIAHFDLGHDIPGRLLFIVHHLACDALSLRILIEDFITAYKQLVRGDQLKLPAKTASAKLRAERLLEYIQSSDLHEELDYWLHLPWAQAAEPPLDYPEHLSKPPIARFVEVTLSKEQTQRLFADSTKWGNAGVRNHLLAALVQVFTSWMQTQGLVISLLNHGRSAIFEDLDLSRTVGWLAMNSRIFLTLPSPRTRGHQLLQAISQQLNAVPNEGISLELLQNQSDKLQALPKPCVVLNYMGQNNTPPSMHPASESPGVDAPLPNIWKNNLHFLLIEIINSCLYIRWEYSSQVYRHQTICTQVDQFIQALTTLHE